MLVYLVNCFRFRHELYLPLTDAAVVFRYSLDEVNR